MEKQEDRKPILITEDGEEFKPLWRERKALEILQENPFWSLYKVGQEMVRRGYTKDPRYLYKRLYYLQWGSKSPVSEAWKRDQIKQRKYAYIPD